MFEQNVTSPFTTTVTTPSQTQAQKTCYVIQLRQAAIKYSKAIR